MIYMVCIMIYSTPYDMLSNLIAECTPYDIEGLQLLEILKQAHINLTGGLLENPSFQYIGV